MVDSRVFTVFRGMQKCLGGSKYRGLADVLSSKTVLSECQQVGVLSAFAHGPEDRVRVDPGGVLGEDLKNVCTLRGNKKLLGARGLTTRNKKLQCVCFYMFLMFGDCFAMRCPTMRSPAPLTLGFVEIDPLK